MANHVSTCMEHEIIIKKSSQAAHRSREQQEGKGREKKKERERKERKGGKEKRERRRRNGERKKEKRKAVFRRSKLIRARSEVCIFNESWAQRGRDSSYLGLFLSFELLCLVCFWDHVVPCLWHILWY